MYVLVDYRVIGRNINDSLINVPICIKLCLDFINTRSYRIITPNIETYILVLNIVDSTLKEESRDCLNFMDKLFSVEGILLELTNYRKDHSFFDNPVLQVGSKTFAIEKLNDNPNDLIYKFNIRNEINIFQIEHKPVPFFEKIVKGNIYKDSCKILNHLMVDTNLKYSKYLFLVEYIKEEVDEYDLDIYIKPKNILSYAMMLRTINKNVIKHNDLIDMTYSLSFFFIGSHFTYEISPLIEKKPRFLEINNVSNDTDIKLKLINPQSIYYEVDRITMSKYSNNLNKSRKSIKTSNNSNSPKWR